MFKGLKRSFQFKSLYSAIQSKDAKKVEKLILKGADVNITSPTGYTLLMKAVQDSTPDVVRLLVKAGADVNTKFAERSPLYHAVCYGFRNDRSIIVNILLENGAAIDAKNDKTQETALHKACSEGRFEIAKILIDKGADVDSRDAAQWTPLMNASGSGHTNIVDLLVKRGADVNAVDEFGQNALMGAANKEIADIIEKASVDAILSRFYDNGAESVIGCRISLGGRVFVVDSINHLGDNMVTYNIIDIKTRACDKVIKIPKAKPGTAEYEKLLEAYRQFQ